MKTIMALMFLSSVALANGHSHTHGTSHLRIVEVDKMVSVEFEAPADDLVGFEHAPKTPAQKKAVELMTQLLKTPNALINWPENVNCVLQKTELTGGFGDHTNVRVVHEYACRELEKAKDIKTNIFKNFSKVKTIKVESLRSGKSASKSLSNGKNALPGWE